MALNAVAGLTVVSIPALFEEIGWRGWLLPRLMESTGRRRAVVICSMICHLAHPVCPGGYFASGGRSARMDSIDHTAWYLRIWSRDRLALASHQEHLDRRRQQGALNDWGQNAFKFMSGEGQPRDGLVLASRGLAPVVVGATLLIRDT